MWENDTLSKNHRNLRVSRQEGREGLFSNAPVRTAYSQEYHFENNNLRKIQEAGGEGKTESIIWDSKIVNRSSVWYHY